MVSNQAHQVVVIGGGPAGATAATILAQQGRRVLLLERGQFPRHHIGESLMPHTYHTFKRLGMLSKLTRTDFPTKESVQFVAPDGIDSAPFYFTDWRDEPSSRTWQVRRDEFDQMMLQNAREHGVEVRLGARVKQVLFEQDRAVGVQYLQDAATHAVACDVVVDASGINGLLSRQLNLRYADAKLKNGAIYAYYKHAARDRGRNAGATVIIHTPDRAGWFWFIPLSDTLTSVGLVASPAYLFSGRGDDPAGTLEEEIEKCPGAARRLASAQCVSQTYVTSDFSYRSRQIAGAGWVLVGDAFGFLDPVYSSGVMLALKSGELAADSIHEALDAGDLSGERLGRFGPVIADGMQSLRMLVYAFYDPAFSVGRFAKAHPEHQERLIRTLVGDVFDGDLGPMFDTMRQWVELPQTLEEPAASDAGVTAG